MSKKNNRTVIDMVTEYEAMLEMGVATFLDEDTCSQLIEYYEQDEQVDRALELVEHAIKHFPFSIDFFVKRAQLFVGEEKMEAALESLEQAAAFSPSAPEILLLRAEIYIYQGWLEDALAILETLKDGAGRQLLSEIYFVESIAYEQQNMHERMYFSLRASLNEDPDNEEALERIWHSIDACKCYDEAAVLFEEILEHNAYCSIAWYNLGHVKAYQGHYGEAIDCYEYAYLANEKLEQAYRDCAELCFEMKQFHRALDCYEELLEKFEVDSDILQHIGQCNQHIGNYKIARTFYMQALKYDPLDDEVLFHIGECFAKEENWPRAIR